VVSAEEMIIVVTRPSFRPLWGHEPWQAWLRTCGVCHRELRDF
jgi:hypothetical protein